MKKIFVIFLLFISTVSVAEEDLYLKNQILDSQIFQLTKERDSKWDNLKKCEHDTQGFKIAGITTLVATGIGVYGNIELARKLKGKETDSTVEKGCSDCRTQKQKDQAFCDDVVAKGQATMEECIAAGFQCS